MTVFDYVFYRIAKFFYKRDGSNAPRAIGIVSVIQILIIGEISFLVLRIFYSLSETAKYSKESSKVGIGIALIALVFNYIRYWGKYRVFANRWIENESVEQKRLRGIFVILSIALPFVLLIYMGTAVYR